MGAEDHPLPALATRQHGVVSRLQLMELEFHRRAIARMLQTGRLHRIHRGVYAVGHRRLTTWGRFMAAVLACGEPALLSHRSAATLHNLKTGGSKIEVISASRGRAGPPGITLHTTRDLPKQDRTVIDGIPVTALPRTLVDLAAVVDYRRLGRAFEEAERIQRLDTRAVKEVLRRSHGRRGVKAVHVLLAERRIATNTREGIERDFADELRKAGLQLPAFNVLIEGYLVDAVWPQYKLIVELDSYAFHDRTVNGFHRGRGRYAELVLKGWTVVPLTDRQIPRAAEILGPFFSAARAA
jgi:predicted transcriptional regulator of viral defense system